MNLKFGNIKIINVIIKNDMNLLCKILLVVFTILFFSSCTANTVGSETIVTDTILKKDIGRESIQNPTIAEMTGYWYPVSYTESRSQALLQRDIDSFMKMSIYINMDTIVFFADTVFDLNCTVNKVNTDDYLRMNVEAFYNYKMLDSTLYDVFLKCKKRSIRKGENFSTTSSFAYDGKYILLIVDGVAFLCERQKTPTILTGSGSVVKEYLLKGQERELKLSYEFFSEPDELIVYDQLRRVLYTSGMQSTKQAVSVNIALDGVEKLVFKINAKSSQSQWRYEFSFK